MENVFCFENDAPFSFPLFSLLFRAEYKTVKELQYPLNIPRDPETFSLQTDIPGPENRGSVSTDEITKNTVRTVKWERIK